MWFCRTTCCVCSTSFGWGENESHRMLWGGKIGTTTFFCHTKRTGERAFFRGSAQRRKEAPLHSAKDVSNILPNDIFFFFFLVCAKTSNERESPIKKEEKKKRKIVPKPVRTQRSSRRIHKTQRGTPFFVLWTQTPPTFCSIDD